MKFRPTTLWFYGFAAGGLCVDLVAKWIARTALGSGNQISFLPGLSWALTENDGAAFGTPVPAKGIVTFLLVAGVFAWWRIWEIRKNKIHTDIAFGMILGGALGNAIERWVSGNVTDFLRVASLFVCNIGDILITAGVALIIGWSYFEKTWKGEPAQEESSAKPTRPEWDEPGESPAEEENRHPETPSNSPDGK